MSNYMNQYVLNQISYHAKKWAWRLCMEIEDMKQELALYVLECEKNYDPTKARVNTFVDRIIRHKITNLIRAANTAKRGRYMARVSLETILDEATGYGSDTLHFIAELRLVSDKLPEPLRALFKQLEQHDIREVAELYGISYACVCKRIKKLRLALRNGGI